MLKDGNKNSYMNQRKDAIELICSKETHHRKNKHDIEALMNHEILHAID